jgi:hypothetical protein
VQKVYTSDELLRERGFRQLVSDIRNVNAQKPCTIVIIGGSHSAFSIAWLLLYGPTRTKQFDPPKEFMKASNDFSLSPPQRGPQISYSD